MDKEKRADIISAYGAVLHEKKSVFVSQEALRSPVEDIREALHEELMAPSFPQMVEAVERGLFELDFYIPQDEYNCVSEFDSVFAEAHQLAQQTDDANLAAVFQPLAESLAADEEKIVGELNGVQGSPADIGGYYRPDDAKADDVMRPSATLNAALAAP